MEIRSRQLGRATVVSIAGSVDAMTAGEKETCAWLRPSLGWKGFWRCRALPVF